MKERGRVLVKVMNENSVIILLILLVLFFCFTTSGFATVDNLFTLLRQTSIMGIVAFGMTIVIVAGGIDLTVGSSMSVITVFIMLLIKEWSFPPALACIVGILIAVTIGFINGIVITFTNMTPFICTLAFMQILQGTAYTLSGGLPIFGLSDNMRFIGQGYIFNLIPVPVIIMLVVFVLACLLMMRTYIGRYFYAVGSNSEAARLSGLNINLSLIHI